MGWFLKLVICFFAGMGAGLGTYLLWRSLHSPGAASHFAIAGISDGAALVFCILATLLWARIAARFANKAAPETLNRATGAILAALGIVILGLDFLAG